MRFQDQVAFVTGAGSGIGFAAAQRINAEGGTVVCGLEHAGQAEAIAGLDHAEIDVRELDSWRVAISHIADVHGGIDILVNSAGIRMPGNAEQIERAAWDDTIAVNLTGVFLGCRTVIPAMRRRGGGAIINVASFNGVRGVPGTVAYSASKGVVLAMTMSLALDHAADNIRVNCVCPGMVDTAMSRRAFDHEPNPSAAYQAMADRHPLGRLAEPNEIAGVIAHLASTDASFMTGQAVAVDGGRTATG